MGRKKIESTDGAIKPKSLFDHINQIRLEKNPNYFSTLTDADKKTWSNYMICRFLSMQPELVEAINDLQIYQGKLSPEYFYRLCIEIVPYGKSYYPYVKSGADKYNSVLTTMLSEYYQESIGNVIEYMGILPRSHFVEIAKMHGKTDKEIKDLFD